MKNKSVNFVKQLAQSIDRKSSTSSKKRKSKSRSKSKGKKEKVLV